MGDSLLAKLGLSLVIIIAAIPGLVVEPGPFSEVAAVGLLILLWLPDSKAAEKVE